MARDDGQADTAEERILTKALLAAHAVKPMLSPSAGSPPADLIDRANKLETRADFLESRAADPKGYERIIGASDLTAINYLERGRRAADAVCRIRAPSDGGEWCGTGFLVGPRLLLTNHHVLGNAGEAGQAEAEFAYEHDLDGVLKDPIAFNLLPHELFFTDPVLDITLVAVAPLSERGVPVERFGWLPLLPLSGKGVGGEWVTIIQHPNGGPKQISIRSNRIVTFTPEQVPGVDLDRFVHYLTDTEPGSSGAPVVNDQWQVVAVHHKAVAAPRDPTAPPSAQPQWIGNEGVRVSAIYRTLETRRLTHPDARRALERLEAGLGLPPVQTRVSLRPDEANEADGKPYAVSRWSGQEAVGYDHVFLSQPLPLLPMLARLDADGLLAPRLDGQGPLLDYNRFSVAIHAERKFAVIAAVNIDGSLLKHPGDRPGTWRRDARMAPEYQPAGDFYEKAKGSDPVQFSRGHLVRRFDPSWADTVEAARLGDLDTFHYTNAAPQVQSYNDVDWGNLEDYVLNRAELTERRMTVLQGPIFRDDDPWYGHDRLGGPWRIPLSYWKVAVVQKTKSRLACAAFIVGQTQYVQALYEAKVFSGLRPYTMDDMRSRKIQTTVESIEAETGLNLAPLRAIDAHSALESTRQTRWINRLDDIII